MKDFEKQFKEFLVEKELKLTRSRSLILEAVSAMQGHFDAEMLYDRLKDDSVSLATVYRTLPLLVDAGLIQLSVRMEGRDRFERTLGHPQHVHWICENCRSVVESDLGKIKELLKEEAHALKFEIDQFSINVGGLCWKCRTNENDSQ
ncbi:MAG: transcriptional repressor [Candidatus Cloacimonetes bacterium]|nr:transcriptional repressor [Candidatus Cloacimonadota bacterium]